jgi:DNA-binding PadR family transcriptional regulator
MAYTVLCQLAEGPAHPYKLQRLIRERGKEWILNLKTDSLYHAIHQLERAGLIERTETEREGNRPERRVYQITEAGLEEVEARTYELMTKVENDFPKAIAPLSHLAGLEPEQVRQMLQLRATQLAGSVAQSEVLLKDFEATGFPRIFVIEVEYALALRRAELAWTRKTIAELDDGTLTWSAWPGPPARPEHPARPERPGEEAAAP